MKIDKSSMPRTIEDFVTKAAKGPSYFQIKILEIVDLFDALIKAPMDALFSLEEREATDSLDLLRSKSLGVCPKCHTATNGMWLVHMHVVSGLGPHGAMALMSKDYARFLIGKCRNPNCDCEDILIFWRSDEDKEMIDRLTEMGIKIKEKEMTRL